MLVLRRLGGNNSNPCSRASCYYDHRNHQRYSYPGKSPNPWVNDGQFVSDAYGWVSLDIDSSLLDLVEGISNLPGRPVEARLLRGADGFG